MNFPRSKLRGIRRNGNLYFRWRIDIRQRTDGFTQQAAGYQTRRQTKMKKLYTNWQTKLLFAAIATVAFLVAANSAVAQKNWERGDEWRSQYKIGDKVQHSISGNESGFQTCTVTENEPGDLMRVRCDAFKYWVAGVYIASERSIRPLQKAKNPANNKQTTNKTDAEEIPADETEWSEDDKWRRYKVGDEVQISISTKAADIQTCTVAENNPHEAMRVKCNAFKHWVAGTYIVSESNFRLTDTLQKNKPAKQTGSSSSGLKVGEYACYGTGGRIMIGLGFKVLSGNRYTDLEGGNRGSFVITGNTVNFRGGHLGGQTGRDIRDPFRFTIGTKAVCEPFSKQ